MFKKWFCFLGLAIGIAIPTFAQDNSAILLQVGNEKVDAEEFWAIYKKNSRINQQSEKTSIDDYLDLYINFKLKVKEAKDAKLDTSASFIKELEGYRKQLVKPYLVIEEVNEQAIRDAYERMKTNVRARHILFRLAENASPKDTLAVYEKAQEVRNQILSGKLTFVQAALQYSEDPSVRDMDMGEGRPVRPGNKGDLGYFGVFDMVYPFEEATFNLDLNEISAPTRTRFGYHLIQLTDKIPAIGQVKAAHIFIQKSNPNSPIDSAKVRIDELYNQLQNGVPFEKVVLESDDKGSSAQGGELPLFTANRMVPQFIEAISKLKIGEVSVPVQTSFGWHIIKFIEQKPIDSFDKVKEDIEEKLKRDIRSKKGEQAKIAQIKAEENYREYPEALLELVEVVDSNFYAKDFEITSLRKYSKPVLTLRDETTTQYDFLSYLFENRASAMPENVGFVIRNSFKEFADKQCLAFEDKHLEEKEFDFRMIMNEYRDGILLFDLMDKKVWSKASADTLGLENYYNQNKKKYQWKKRAVLSVFEFKSPEYADSIKNMILQGKTDEEILAYFAPDSLKQVTLKTEIIEKESKAEIDALKWKKEAVYLLNNEQGKAKSVVVFRDILQPSQKDFSETRGMVIANYQDFLEKKWIDELKEKYEVVVNKDVLKELKKRKE